MTELDGTLSYETAKQWASLEAFKSYEETLTSEAVKQWTSLEAFKSYEKKLIWAPTFMICIGPGCNSGQIHKGGDTQPIRPWASVQFGTNSRGRRRSAHYDMRSMELRTNEGGDTQLIMTCTACTFKMCWTHHLRKPQSMDAIFHRRFNKSDSKKPSVPVKWERFTKADC